VAVGAPRAASIGLVVDPRQRRNRFGRYAGEILLAEGIGDFEEVDLARVTLGALRRFGVVVLTNCGPVAGLLETLAAYVEAGGRLLLLRPAPELAPLLGLRPQWRSRAGASLLVDSRSPAFGGFPYEPVQVVGPVDLYRAADEGLGVVARTVAGDWPVEPYPAIVARAAGAGRVLAFLYDLPHTVARLRQGDPALAGSDTDGLEGVRPSDAVQGQIDPRAGHIPQAEVHQALLARAVEALCPWPLPRLWYLPGEAQAVVLLTGDLCADRPDRWLVEGAALAERYGAGLTYYLCEETALRPETAAALRGRGHELSVHPFAAPFSAPAMDEALGRHPARFRARYGGRPRTVRHHCLQWLGWAEQARLERKHGLEMDLNFTTARPVRNGYSFGAGRPLRFVDEDGEVLPVWQQPTHFEDDLILGDHEISLRAGTGEACALYDELLDGAVRAWHTALAVNLHPGHYRCFSGEWGRHLVARTAAGGVPIWTPERWLDFTAARAGLRVRRPEDRGRAAWRIDVPDGAASGDLVLLVPERFDGEALREPAGGPAFDVYGWRYRAVPLRGAPAAFDAVYGRAGGVHAYLPAVLDASRKAKQLHRAAYRGWRARLSAPFLNRGTAPAGA
jgi:hypothetical protein